MTLSADLVMNYVQTQLEMISDVLVRDAIAALLVQPQLTFRVWYDDSGLEPEPCWVFARHTASGTEFVYADLVFAVPLPWGIVNASDRYLGMDSNWFTTLEEAFYDSFAGYDLPVWNVVKAGADESHRIIAASLTGSAASELHQKLNQAEGLHPHDHKVYQEEPRRKAQG